MRLNSRAWAVIAAILLISVFQSPGQPRSAYYISGIVRDSVTNQGVPYASVVVSGEAAGTLTDDNGLFQLTAPNKAASLQVACLGYEKKVVPVSKGYVNMYDIALSPVATQLQEVVIHRKKTKKKDNPAYAFVRRLKEAGPLTDPRRNPYYNYDKYEIMTFALNDFTRKDEKSWMFRKFPFLWDHVDTSEISGKPILNIMVKEKSSAVRYRRSPKSRKEIVNGIRQEGLDEILDQNSMLTFMEDVLREVNIYDRDINILQNRFVSPLSPIAPDFYKFYLTDTVEVDSEKCVVLSFYPHNTASFGFNGHVFVVAGDSTMFVKRVTMRTPANINLNFIDNLYISQEFERAPDGSRLKKTDDLTIEAKFAPGTPALYARRNIAYSNHNFTRPEDESVFDRLGERIVTTEASERDTAFWDASRKIYVIHNEKRVSDMMRQLRAMPLYYWTEKFLKIMFTGYVNTGNPSKFDYGPVNTSVSRNSIEGWRFRSGGMTTANLSKRWFGRGYIAYGTDDHRWKYRAEAEYSFIDKEYHSREFPMHSLRLTSSYDINHLGQHYLFTNSDNMFLSFRRMKDIYATYRYCNSLEYILELRNNLSFTAKISNEIEEATPTLPFVDGNGYAFKNYSETSLTVQLRYAPGEKYYQTKSYRIPINQDAPVLTLSHKIAPERWFGSKYCVNTTEASVQKRFWFSAFGFADVLLKGGHVWSKSPYPSLLIPNANLSYTIQPESYALMNPMEFINDSYGAWDVTYWLNGALLNLVPYVKQLRLREVVAFRGLWGHLSRRNDPCYHAELFRFPDDLHVTRLSGRPYMELSAGLDNILRCLRVDYVWRLSYLDVPYAIDRHGLRIAMHMTF